MNLLKLSGAPDDISFNNACDIITLGLIIILLIMLDEYSGQGGYNVIDCKRDHYQEQCMYVCMYIYNNIIIEVIKMMMMMRMIIMYIYT